MRIGYFVLLVCLISCPSQHKDSVGVIPDITLNTSDTSLHFLNGYWYRSQQLFSGYIVQRYDDGKTNLRTGYYNGKEEGWAFAYFPNGILSEKRYYSHGEKDSVHTGWWENGKMRFSYHFKAGVYNGYFREWYISGPRYKEIYYIDGNEQSGKGWRENGKMYMNFIVKDGRRYGIENSNMCYQVKKDSPGTRVN